MMICQLGPKCLKFSLDRDPTIFSPNSLLSYAYSCFWLGSYILEFDDDEEEGALPQRIVPFHKVVALPDGHRQ